MSGAALEIRPAVEADAAPLADFASRAFTDAFGADNNPADLALHLERSYTPAAMAAALAAPGHLGLLALEGRVIVGYAILGAGRPAPCGEAPAPCEVRRFYVDRSRHGTGVALKLMDAAVAAARAAGCRSLWLTTWERNPRGLAFYAKSGFEDVGTTVFMVGTDPQTDRVLLRRID